LVTRAAHQASKLTTMLREAGAEVIEIPSIEIRPPESWRALDEAVRKIASYDWLILTSVNSIEPLFARLEHADKSADALRHLRICAIGPATKAAIEARDLSVAVVPKRYVAESVVEALRDKVKGQRVLLVRAKVARDVIPEELHRAGAAVDVVEAYQTVVPVGSRERVLEVLRDPERQPHAITFTSSSTASNFVEMLGGAAQAREQLRGIALASIGPVTSKTLESFGLAHEIEASEFTMRGLVQALIVWSRRSY
jgi:uroporphyrinogen-III synthase